MSLTKFNKNINYHQSQPDKPVLTATELKRLFDQVGLDIKEYINTILTEEIDEETVNINNKIREIINNKNIIVAGIGNDIIRNGAGEIDLHDTTILQVGTDFTLNNNGIICNKSGYVEISASVGIDATRDGQNLRLNVLKNNDGISSTPIRKNVTTTQGFNTAPKIVQVSEGDALKATLSYWLTEDTSNTVTVKSDTRFTYVTVKYI